MKKRRPSEQPNQWLGELLTVKVDRQLGSKHPRYASIEYELNYGFVPETMAADGHEIDAYLIGVTEPVDEFEGQCIAIVHRKDDVEDKLIVAPVGTNFNDEEIMEKVNFQERFFNLTLISRT
jgi:inorganic pyrophosphatase